MIGVKLFGVRVLYISLVAVLLSSSANAEEGLPQFLKHAKFRETINLIDKVDIDRDARDKSWSKSDNGLTSKKSGTASLTIPVDLPENYLLRATIQRVENNDSLGIGFRVGSSGTVLMLNYAGGKLSGFYYVDDVKPDNEKNVTATKQNLISNLTPSELIIAVLGDRVVVTIDGKHHIDWSGDPARLSIKGWNGIPNAERLTLGSYYSSWNISRLEVTPITGFAKSVPPDAKSVEVLQKQLEKDLEFSLKTSNAIECAALAKRLSAAGLQEEDEERRYALLVSAADFAARGGDGLTAWNLIDTLNEQFDIDALQAKLDILKTLSRLRAGAPSPYVLALRCHELASLALESHDYSRARQLMRESLAFAKRGRNDSLVLQLGEIDRQWARWEDEYAKVKASHETFNADPANAQARSVWGRFLCLTCSRWDEGLPVLAKSDDVLAVLAARELELPQEYQAIARMMDDWLKAAEQESEAGQAFVIRNHAYDVGQRAIPLASEDQRPSLLASIERYFGQIRIWDTHQTNTGVELGHPQANIGVEGTVELWLRTRESDGCVIKKRLEAGESTLGMRITNGTVGYYSQGFNYAAFLYSLQRVDDGLWHHLALVKQGNQLRLFIDGQPAGEPNEIRPELKSKASWHLGFSRVDNRLPLHASFARIRISGSARYHVPFTPEFQYGPDRTTLAFE